jgi:hypothetical protein
MDNTKEQWDRCRIRAFHATEDVKRAMRIPTIEDQVCEQFIAPIVTHPAFDAFLDEINQMLAEPSTI